MKPSTRSLVAVMVLLVLPTLVSGAAPATSKPVPHASKPVVKNAPAPAAGDIAGRWKLDVEHSDFGAMATSKPRERVDRWAREGPELHVRSATVRASGDTLKLDWRCREDGTAVDNTLMGTTVKTVGTRGGAVWHLVFTASGGFGSIVTDERWTLSADHATLTLERTTKSSMGQYQQRYVFRRA